jgi:hypothetical protein
MAVATALRAGAPGSSLLSAYEVRRMQARCHGSVPPRECGLFEEAGGHGVQMDVLVHDTADHFCSRDCRLSSARRAVTHAPRLDSSLSFGETGFDGGAKLAVANIGE